MRLTTRWILPVSSPPIKDGVIEIEGNQIKRISATTHNPSGDRSEIISLGDMILLPGFVNAHCHLHLSALRGLIDPNPSYTHWVHDLNYQSAGLTPSEWQEGIGDGVQELLRGGTTTVADHCDPAFMGNDQARLLRQSPLRKIFFLEVLGANLSRAKESLETAQAQQRTLTASNATSHISPHSLYAVHQEVLEKIFGGGAALRSIHLLESAEEEQFFRQQRGPLANFVTERGGDVSFPLSSPVKWLAAVGALKNLLLIHANYLTPEEIALLQGTGASVIHCPGSHRCFGHRPFPLLELKKRGINIALGTDSLASNEHLSMFREMALLREAFSTLSAQEILQMSTIHGARALGLEKQIGTVEVGKLADLIGIQINKPFSDPYDLVLRAKQVDWMMINGGIVSHE